LADLHTDDFSSIQPVPSSGGKMNILKLLLFLISSFTALHVNGDGVNRSLFPEDPGLFFPDYPLSAQAGLQASIKKIDEIDTGGLFWGGFLGNILGVLGGSMLLEKDSKTTFPSGLMTVVGTGSVLGSATGVYLAGLSQKAKGNFGSALLGSILGEIAGFGLFAALVNQGTIGAIGGVLSLAILPPLGSAILFKNSVQQRSYPKGDALLNLAEGRLGLGVPAIHFSLRPFLTRDVKTDCQFTARILSVEL
jgi:predicted membrane protein